MLLHDATNQLGQANNYERLKEVITKIAEYWLKCESPDYIKNTQKLA
jgi:hypothetical protein